jgi:cytochrome c553
MFERFTQGARRAVVLAQEESRALRHPYIGTEHLLLGLIAEGEGVAAQALADAGATAPRVAEQIVTLVGMGPTVPEGHIPFTPRAKAALEKSLRVALEMRHNHIATGHVLLGILRVPDSLACRVLYELGVDPHGLYNFMAPRMAVRTEVLDTDAAATPAAEPAATKPAATECALCHGTAARRAALVTVDRTAVVCDACLRAGVEALDAEDGTAIVPHIGAASPEGRDLVEPGRTVWVTVRDGVTRTDPGIGFEAVAAAHEGVAGALAKMFVLSPDGAALPHVAGGENLGRSLREAQAKHQYFARTPAVTLAIDLAGESSARVQFALGNADEGAKWMGDVIKVGDSWMVSRATVVAVLQQAGVDCPVEGG